MHDLNDLFYFAKVVEAGGFAAAGRTLGIPKSRLSRRIAELEQRLGARLLQRSTRKLALTDIGERYLRHCQAMLLEAEQAEESTGREVLPEQIIVTSGAMGALFSTLTCLLDPGDEVIILNPSWPNYQMQLQLLGATARVVETSSENAYLPTIQQLEEATNAATKALLINTPCNPTGAMFSGDLLNEIAQFARRADLFLIADEVYNRITFEEPQIPTACYDTDGRVVSINSFSKTYAMTGWRVGYAIAPASLAPLIRKCQEPTVGCVNAPAQYACLAALTGPQHLVEEMRIAYLSRRDIALEMLSQANIPVCTPGGAFYLWVDISQSGRTAKDFSLDLIHNHQDQLNMKKIK